MQIASAKLISQDLAHSVSVSENILKQVVCNIPRSFTLGYLFANSTPGLVGNDGPHDIVLSHEQTPEEQITTIKKWLDHDRQSDDALTPGNILNLARKLTGEPDPATSDIRVQLTVLAVMLVELEAELYRQNSHSNQEIIRSLLWHGHTGYNCLRNDEYISAITTKARDQQITTITALEQMYDNLSWLDLSYLPQHLSL